MYLLSVGFMRKKKLHSKLIIATEHLNCDLWMTRRYNLEGVILKNNTHRIVMHLKWYVHIMYLRKYICSCIISSITVLLSKVHHDFVPRIHRRCKLWRMSMAQMINTFCNYLKFVIFTVVFKSVLHVAQNISFNVYKIMFGLIRTALSISHNWAFFRHLFYGLLIIGERERQRIWGCNTLKSFKLNIYPNSENIAFDFLSLMSQNHSSWFILVIFEKVAYLINVYVDQITSSFWDTIKGSIISVVIFLLIPQAAVYILLKCLWPILLLINLSVWTSLN